MINWTVSMFGFRRTMLSCESGQENVTIYHAKDNGSECPIYMWTCMDITLSGCYYGCSREEIIAITMAFNLVKHIVPYLYNPSIFKALYMNWRFLMLKWFKEKHSTPFLITFKVLIVLYGRSKGVASETAVLGLGETLLLGLLFEKKVNLSLLLKLYNGILSSVDSLSMRLHPQRDRWPCLERCRPSEELEDFMNGRFSMLKWFQVKHATHVLVLINSKLCRYDCLWWKDKPSKGT
ncbi:hypothetical protein P8452_69970 [Trifolium repens]|nr:hypothetical protein P8452_69970 [Trifolium repens]